LGWLEELAESFSDEEKGQITAAMELIINKAKQIDTPKKRE